MHCFLCLEDYPRNASETNWECAVCTAQAHWVCYDKHSSAQKRWNAELGVMEYKGGCPVCKRTYRDLTPEQHERRLARANAQAGARDKPVNIAARNAALLAEQYGLGKGKGRKR